MASKTTKKRAAKPVKKQEETAFHGGWGRVVERKTRASILTCACGNKYLKTRKGQTVCLRCLFRPA